ncbi:MAG: hypothetical protein HY080_17130 [Gammaproteobacteria bacterium]|nr:hypothetical protein [Gammaproteobacteria bacterium]
MWPLPPIQHNPSTLEHTVLARLFNQWRKLVQHPATAWVIFFLIAALTALGGASSLQHRDTVATQQFAVISSQIKAAIQQNLQEYT